MSLKKIILFLTLSLTIGSLKAQSYAGLLTDNYNGIHGVISNPANIADSRLKLDINLFGASALFGNDYIGFNLNDAFSDFSEAFDNAATFPSIDNFLAWNIDILGPSVMLSIDEKQSIAVFSRVRAVFNLYDVNGEILELEGGFDENEDFFINEGDVNGSFSYSLQVDDELDIDNIEIPLMLIHPFVENAITHGLINKKDGDKNLSVWFKNQGDFTVCEVEDNGIGRKASTRMGSILKKTDKQRGIEIAVKRLELQYDRSIDKKNVVKIIDKYDSEGISAGTKVTIKLNKTLKETT